MVASTYTTVSLALLLASILGFETASLAQSKVVPLWAEGEKVPVQIKQKDAPPYLQLKQTATVMLPKAITSGASLEKLNPGLTKVLPGLRTMLPKATISLKFKTLYDSKIKSIASGDFLPVHYFYDCATVLNLTDPKTERHAVLFQSDMDTDTDGSDPVRKPLLKDYDDARISGSFQPVLAYSWEMTDAAKAPSPFLGYYKDTLAQLQALKGQVDVAADRDVGPIWKNLSKAFSDQMAAVTRQTRVYGGDLRDRRSLIASVDPFIVVPMNWIDKEANAYRMAVGDLAVVVYAGKIIPCIIGDTGPNDQTGEGSQRLARALNAKASGKVSAVTTAAVSYIVFPNSRIAGAPDLARYHTEVTRLLGELGGLGEGVQLHKWD